VSYLHPVRLHFSGRFRADVSTVNNDSNHYDTAHFSPDCQKPGAGATKVTPRMWEKRQMETMQRLRAPREALQTRPAHRRVERLRPRQDHQNGRSQRRAAG
jgi:hypothetical protein